METVRIGFWRRVLAAIVDGIIIAVLTFVPAMVLGAVLGPVVAAIVGGVLGMAYYSTEVRRAQTLGKMIFSYRITAQDGSPATRDQLVKRWAYKQVPQALMIIAAVPMLGFVGMIGGLAALVIVLGTIMALKPERLALHDQLFGTAVYGPETLGVTVPSMARIKGDAGGASTPTPATAAA